MNQLETHEDLARLGDALRAATTVDLTRERGSTATRRPLWRRPRIIAGMLVAAAAIPGGAAVAGAFDSPQQVASSMPAGTLALQGTEPSCTIVTPGLTYDCLLAQAPSDNGGPEPGHWLSTVEPTEDASGTVNGGCRSLNAAGTHWTCYLGQKAVDEQIIGQSLLGQHADGPGVG